MNLLPPSEKQVCLPCWFPSQMGVPMEE